MRIQNKLFLFLISFSLVLVTVLVILIQWSIGKGMVEYVLSKEIEALKPVVTQLANSYQKNHNWRSMQGQHSKLRRLTSKALNNTDFDINRNIGPPNRKPINDKFRLPPHLRDKKALPHETAKGTRPQIEQRSGPLHKRPPPPRDGAAQYALLDSEKNLIAGSYQARLDYVQLPIIVDEITVGFFAVSKRNQLTQGYEVDFIEQQQHYLWLISILVMCLVALVTFPLARHIVEPIKKIANGMHKLTQGDYQHPVNLDRTDELGQLGIDYNELALTLAENENTRKRWLADISHELRTPIAILRGELEAMLDGVRPLIADNISSAHDEVKHLQRLIDDLNILTSTDIGGMRYRKQHINLVSLLKNDEKKYTDYLLSSGIQLSYAINIETASVYVDVDRIIQLFENIINNSIKYSEAKCFKVSLNTIKYTSSGFDQNSLESAGKGVELTFEDDGVGVDESHLDHLFEHLYRVEESRNRKTGGSGLGLSICRHIVIAHQGYIKAKKSTLGGLAVVVTLPSTLDN